MRIGLPSLPSGRAVGALVVVFPKWVRQPATPRVRLRLRRPPLWAWMALIATVLLLLIRYEARTSALQSRLLARLAAKLSWSVSPGPSPSIVFPSGGPFDERLGYARLPRYQERLEERGFKVIEQARFSPPLARLARWGISPPFRERSVPGLLIRDGEGRAVFHAAPGSRMLLRYEDVPPPVVTSLLFIENRELEDPPDPRSNPAVDWNRFAKAGLLYGGRKLGLPLPVEGGSTLATQIEKYRHSRDGRTASGLEKMRQMLAASLKAYREGVDTRPERREIVLEYLNTMPLAATAAYGEVFGLGEGLYAWFGRDLEGVLADMYEPRVTEAKARAFKELLSLVYATHAPSRYLIHDRIGLEERVGVYLGLLSENGLIDPALARAAERVPLVFSEGGRRLAAPMPLRADKSVQAIRERVRELLGEPGLYETDHLDLEVRATLDGQLQEATTRLFRALKDPAFLAQNGLTDRRTLAMGDPDRVAYSLLLYEATPEGNLLRVHADSLGIPFDLNEGMKMELGSTAKLRTLAHYLELVAGLYGEMHGRSGVELWERVRTARDPITLWAAQDLSARPGSTLEQFLEHALNRSYSGSPGEAFFTGGGIHYFSNFDREENGLYFTVREATAASVNLSYVRLMRDLVRFHTARLEYSADEVLEDTDSPRRKRMLEEIADREQRESLARAHRAYRGLSEGEIVKRLLGRGADSPRRLAMLFYAWHRGGDAGALAAWLAAHGVPKPAAEAPKLERAYGSSRLTLADYGYLLDREPIEVYCAGELARNRDVSYATLLEASGEARRDAAAWLFRPKNRRAQDLRLRIRIEQDAFGRMTPYWQHLGFPFEKLVPSYATAIGSSSDRPAALAELIGIIVNDGVRRADRSLEQLRFATGTPYHTVFESEAREERVMAPEVARAIRDVLLDVVEEGTARRVRGAFVDAAGNTIPVGGKTGSGDNRFETFGRGGTVRSSRAINRTGVFVFYVGDRFYGVLTASVLGAGADDYSFTSSLPLGVLKVLAPEINARIAPPAEEPAEPAARASL